MKTCNDCIFYESFRDAYFGDEMEPDDQGFCAGNESKDNHTFGYHTICKYFQPRYK